MENEIKCPNCGGNRYTMVDEKSAKCKYCGTVFKAKEDKSEHSTHPEQPATKQAPIQEKIIIVQQPSVRYEEKYGKYAERNKDKRYGSPVGCIIISIFALIVFLKCSSWI